MRTRIADGRDLDQLVVGDQLDGRLDRELPRRRELDGVVGRVGADVGLLLLLGHVDDHVAGPGVLAHDHALVHGVAGVDEQLAPQLEVVERVGHDDAGPVGHHGAAPPVGELAGPRRPAPVAGVKQRGPAGGGHQLRAEAQQAAGRGLEAHDRAAGVARPQLEHRALAGRQRLGHRAHVLVGHVDDAFLDRLVALAVDLAGDDLRLAHLQLVALAPHRLDQHGELELAPAGDLEHVGLAGVVDLDGDVAQHLAGQAVAEVAAGDVLADLAGQRRRVDAERHAQHGLVDGEAGERVGVGRVGERVADLDLGEAGQHEQVAGDDLLGRRRGRRPSTASSSAGLRATAAPSACTSATGRSARSVPAHDPPDGEAAEVVGRVEVGDQGLERRRRVADRGGHGLAVPRRAAGRGRRRPRACPRPPSSGPRGRWPR